MLEMKKIKKIYKLKDTTVNALKGVTMRFRKSEFVSILGPSGCGKTTLLNVIGGLDRYDSGDLVIDGVSTKNYKDKDWDNYRNHRIGFVFQSYNLIPHQTVLENVELALTLSGTKRSERKRLATEALALVGLKDKLKSKPSQLSGGQMQRVAIARALVNNPEIILADEPTGALDSKTSVQIMDLLKEVSKDRLVIMVTHNPELANQYSSRIIKLLDGELVEDSKPYSEEECEADTKERQQQKQKELEAKKAEQEKSGKKLKHKKEKTSMSFFTALFLSFKNLLSKKGRTILVSLAGSIGIIGIALILAVSSGMTSYINKMQSQSLSSYPVSVSYISVDTNRIMKAVTGEGSGNSEDKTDDKTITVYNPASQISDFGSYNFLDTKFTDYIQNYYSDKEKRNLINDYQFTYASDMHLITKNDALSSMISIPGIEYVPINSRQETSALNSTVSSTFFQGLDKDYVLSFYDVLGGEGAHYPENKGEVALVINGKSMPVTTLLQYGILINGEENKIAVDDIIGTTYRLLYNNAYYDLEGGTSEISKYANFDNFDFLTEIVKLQNSTDPTTAIDPSNEYYGSYLSVGQPTSVAQKLYEDENGIDLKITCVLRLKDDATGYLFNEGIMYTPELGEEYKQNCKNSEVVKTVLKQYFKHNESGFITEDGTIEFENFTMADYNKLQFDETKKDVDFYTTYNPNITEFKSLGMLGDQYKNISDMFNYTSPAKMQEKLQSFKVDLTYNEIMQIYLQVYNASDIPLNVSIYAKSFDAKEDIDAMISAYNAGVKNKITYSDTSQFVTNMLKDLVNIISYVLIAFAAISLVVSSIMIAIITYTSVIERTKEIGVLRSVGASKKDVFWVFTAETVIIGLVAGVIGIGVAGLLSLLVSEILDIITGVGGLAVVQLGSSLALIGISVLLTFIAGLIPSRIATKKDPVLALRSE